MIIMTKRNPDKFTWKKGDLEILPSNDGDESEPDDQEPTEPTKEYLEAVRRRRDLTDRSKGG